MAAAIDARSLGDHVYDAVEEVPSTWRSLLGLELQLSQQV